MVGGEAETGQMMEKKVGQERGGQHRNRKKWEQEKGGRDGEKGKEREHKRNLGRRGKGDGSNGEEQMEGKLWKVARKGKNKRSCA